MQIITTTQLRTKSRQLVETLKKGESVDLIHRSEIIGKIEPKETKSKTFNVERFEKLVKKLNLPSLTDKEVEERYRKAMEEKHGKLIS